MASKVLVTGDVNGRFSEFFKKLAGLHAKQSFAYSIVAGNLFAPEDNEELGKLLEGGIEVPLPTYFSLGNRPLPSAAIEKLAHNEGELCPNLTILGRKVSIKTSEGHRIVAIGGDHAEIRDEPMSDFTATFTDKDVENAKAFTEPHFLITSNWPAGVLNKSQVKYDDLLPKGTGSLGELCTTLKPRYHFSTSERFYEREPFFHPGLPPPGAVTRFISLAPFDNASKQKWAYAFKFDPEAAPPTNGLTACPFHGEKRKYVESGPPTGPNSFRFSNSNDLTRQDSDRRYARRRHAQAPQAPRSCYFCLSTPDCETHMIVSIGSAAYLTIAKGGVSTPTTFPALGVPAHILIIPVVHTPTVAAMSRADDPAATRREMHRYREALQTMVAAKSSDGEGRARLGAVTCEISRSAGVHLHWQFLPMPVDLVERGLVEAGFDVEAENRGFGALVKDPVAVRAIVDDDDDNGDDDSHGHGGEDYFRAMIWTEAGGRRDVVLPLRDIERFDLQFGRRVLAKLLGVEGRAHWKDCPQTHAGEEADAEAFKKVFNEYDWALAGSEAPAE